MGVFDPVGDDRAVFADVVFELFASAELVVCEFGGVGDFLFRGRREDFQVTFFRLAEELLGGDLDFRGGFVFNL